jgi:hypothetical protein
MKIKEVISEASKADKARQKAVANKQRFDIAQQQRDKDEQERQHRVEKMKQKLSPVKHETTPDIQREPNVEKLSSMFGIKLEEPVTIRVTKVEHPISSLSGFDDNGVFREVKNNLDSLVNEHGNIINILAHYPGGVAGGMGSIINFMLIDKDTGGIVRRVSVSHSWYNGSNIGNNFSPKDVTEATKIIGILDNNSMSDLVVTGILKEEVMKGKAADWDYKDGDIEWARSNLDRINWGAAVSGYSSDREELKKRLSNMFASRYLVFIDCKNNVEYFGDPDENIEIKISLRA